MAVLYGRVILMLCGFCFAGLFLVTSTSSSSKPQPLGGTSSNNNNNHNKDQASADKIVFDYAHRGEEEEQNAVKKKSKALLLLEEEEDGKEKNGKEEEEEKEEEEILAESAKIKALLTAVPERHHGAEGNDLYNRLIESEEEEDGMERGVSNPEKKKKKKNLHANIELEEEAAEKLIKNKKINNNNHKKNALGNLASNEDLLQQKFYDELVRNKEEDEEERSSKLVASAKVVDQVRLNPRLLLSAARNKRDRVRSGHRLVLKASASKDEVKEFDLVNVQQQNENNDNNNNDTDNNQKKNAGGGGIEEDYYFEEKDEKRPGGRSLQSLDMPRKRLLSSKKRLINNSNNKNNNNNFNNFDPYIPANSLAVEVERIVSPYRDSEAMRKELIKSPSSISLSASLLSLKASRVRVLNKGLADTIQTANNLLDRDARLLSNTLKKGVYPRQDEEVENTENPNNEEKKLALDTNIKDKGDKNSNMKEDAFYNSFQNSRLAPRVVAIGNVHGDLPAFKLALRTAGVLSEDNNQWIGGQTVVVQLGDLLDHGPDDLAVLEFAQFVKTESQAAGGDFLHLIGNHEIMNVLGYFHYANEESFLPFDSLKYDKSLLQDLFAHVAPYARSRAASLAPGSVFAYQFAQDNPIQIIGDTLFVHSGLSPTHLAYGLENINREVQMWLQGLLPLTPNSPFFDMLTSEDSPFWLNRYTSLNPDCAMVDMILKSLVVKQMVIGHSNGQLKGVSAACGKRLWRVDLPMLTSPSSSSSSSFGTHQGTTRGQVALGNRLVQVLEFNGDQINILSASTATPSFMSSSSSNNNNNNNGEEQSASDAALVAAAAIINVNAEPDSSLNDEE